MSKKLVTTYTITKDDRLYFVEVIMTSHAQKRHSERKIKLNGYGIAGNIMAMGTKILSRVNHDVCIIDPVNEVTIIVAIDREGKSNTLTASVVTVIDKSDVFVKKHTDVVKIDELF